MAALGPPFCDPASPDPSSTRRDGAAASRPTDTVCHLSSDPASVPTCRNPSHGACVCWLCHRDLPPRLAAVAFDADSGATCARRWLLQPAGWPGRSTLLSQHSGGPHGTGGRCGARAASGERVSVVRGEGPEQHGRQSHRSFIRWVPQASWLSLQISCCFCSARSSGFLSSAIQNRLFTSVRRRLLDASVRVALDLVRPGTVFVFRYQPFYNSCQSRHNTLPPVIIPVIPFVRLEACLFQPSYDRSQRRDRRQLLPVTRLSCCSCRLVQIISLSLSQYSAPQHVRMKSC